MAFFKRILREPPPAASLLEGGPLVLPPPVERRRAPRFAVSPDFPLKAVLNYVGRDDTGAPMSNSRHNWHWKGRLIDCSEYGARLQLGPGLRAVIGETCDLRLGVQEFELVVPCHVTNIRGNDEGMVFGLLHDIADPAVLGDYRQFVEIIALGSTLRLRTRTPQPDDSGYFVERYASTRPSSLTVWRHPRTRAVSAFELILKDCQVRAAAGRGAEYFSGEGDGARRASAARCLEIHRLFQWVVPNLPATMPEDVRRFLWHHAT
jgi:hypothetical protein